MSGQVTGRDGHIIGSAITKVIEHLTRSRERVVLGRDKDKFVSALEQFMSGAAARTPGNEGSPPANFMELAITALYLAIRFEQAKPKRDQAWSDMQDMKAILLHHGRDYAIQFMKHDEAAGIRPADLIDERCQPAQLN